VETVPIVELEGWLLQHGIRITVRQQRGRYTATARGLRRQYGPEWETVHGEGPSPDRARVELLRKLAGWHVRFDGRILLVPTLRRGPDDLLPVATDWRMELAKEIAVALTRFHDERYPALAMPTAIDLLAVVQDTLDARRLAGRQTAE
jgi:pyruvate-formate lyase-activating enzyme